MAIAYKFPYKQSLYNVIPAVLLFSPTKTDYRLSIKGLTIDNLLRPFIEIL